MTEFEKSILKYTKELNEQIIREDLHTTAERIKESEEFKELSSEDKAALMAIMSLRASLALEDKKEKEPQALWRFIRYLTEVEMPLQFVDYTYFLFPDNEKYFAKILTPTAFNLIQRQAKLMLDNNNYEDEKHKEHLTKIANGQMPYGYSLEMPSIKEESEDK